MATAETTTVVSKSPVPSPKAPVKAASKPAAMPATKKAPAKAAKSVTKGATKVAAKPAAPKAPKEKKIKMVRDSFTMPKPEFVVLDVLKVRAAKMGSPVKKTELLRAGIKALAAMSDAAFLTAVRAVPSLKTGRPAKTK